MYVRTLYMYMYNTQLALNVVACSVVWPPGVILQSNRRKHLFFNHTNTESAIIYIETACFEIIHEQYEEQHKLTAYDMYIKTTWSHQWIGPKTIG